MSNNDGFNADTTTSSQGSIENDISQLVVGLESSLVVDKNEIIQKSDALLSSEQEKDIRCESLQLEKVPFHDDSIEKSSSANDISHDINPSNLNEKKSNPIIKCLKYISLVCFLFLVILAVDALVVYLNFKGKDIVIQNGLVNLSSTDYVDTAINLQVALPISSAMFGYKATTGQCTYKYAHNNGEMKLAGELKLSFNQPEDYMQSGKLQVNAQLINTDFYIIREIVSAVLGDYDIFNTDTEVLSLQPELQLECSFPIQINLFNTVPLILYPVSGKLNFPPPQLPAAVSTDSSSSSSSSNTNSAAANFTRDSSTLNSANANSANSKTSATQTISNIISVKTSSIYGLEYSIHLPLHGASLLSQMSTYGLVFEHLAIHVPTLSYAVNLVDVQDSKLNNISTRVQGFDFDIFDPNATITSTLSILCDSPSNDLNATCTLPEGLNIQQFVFLLVEENFLNVTMTQSSGKSFLTSFVGSYHHLSSMTSDQLSTFVNGNISGITEASTTAHMKSSFSSSFQSTSASASGPSCLILNSDDVYATDACMRHITGAGAKTQLVGAFIKVYTKSGFAGWIETLFSWTLSEPITFEAFTLGNVLNTTFDGNFTFSETNQKSSAFLFIRQYGIDKLIIESLSSWNFRDYLNSGSFYSSLHAQSYFNTKFLVDGISHFSYGNDYFYGDCSLFESSNIIPNSPSIGGNSVYVDAVGAYSGDLNDWELNLYSGALDINGALVGDTDGSIAFSSPFGVYTGALLTMFVRVQNSDRINIFASSNALKWLTQSYLQSGTFQLQSFGDLQFGNLWDTNSELTYGNGNYSFIAGLGLQEKVCYYQNIAPPSIIGSYNHAYHASVLAPVFCASASGIGKYYFSPSLGYLTLSPSAVVFDNSVLGGVIFDTRFGLSNHDQDGYLDVKGSLQDSSLKVSRFSESTSIVWSSSSSWTNAGSIQVTSNALSYTSLVYNGLFSFAYQDYFIPNEAADFTEGFYSVIVVGHTGIPNQNINSNITGVYYSYPSYSAYSLSGKAIVVFDSHYLGFGEGSLSTYITTPAGELGYKLLVENALGANLVNTTSALGWSSNDWNSAANIYAQSYLNTPSLKLFWNTHSNFNYINNQFMLQVTDINIQKSEQFALFAAGVYSVLPGSFSVALQNSYVQITSKKIGYVMASFSISELQLFENCKVFASINILNSALQNVVATNASLVWYTQSYWSITGGNIAFRSFYSIPSMSNYNGNTLLSLALVGSDSFNNGFINSYIAVYNNKLGYIGISNTTSKWQSTNAWTSDGHISLDTTYDLPNLPYSGKLRCIFQLLGQEAYKSGSILASVNVREGIIGTIFASTFATSWLTLADWTSSGSISGIATYSVPTLKYTGSTNGSFTLTGINDYNTYGKTVGTVFVKDSVHGTIFTTDGSISWNSPSSWLQAGFVGGKANYNLPTIPYSGSASGALLYKDGNYDVFASDLCHSYKTNSPYQLLYANASGQYSWDTNSIYASVDQSIFILNQKVIFQAALHIGTWIASDWTTGKLLFDVSERSMGLSVTNSELLSWSYIEGNKLLLSAYSNTDYDGSKLFLLSNDLQVNFVNETGHYFLKIVLHNKTQILLEAGAFYNTTSGLLGDLTAKLAYQDNFYIGGNAGFDYLQVAPVSTLLPTSQPSSRPTVKLVSPSCYPSISHPIVASVPSFASMSPITSPVTSILPSSSPSAKPSQPLLTASPSKYPSTLPSIAPSIPSVYPTTFPSLQPTFNPTSLPSVSHSPSMHPTILPTMSPTISLLPTVNPTYSPTASPTSLKPSALPTAQPTIFPSVSPAPTSNDGGSTINSLSSFFSSNQNKYYMIGGLVALLLLTCVCCFYCYRYYNRKLTEDDENFDYSSGYRQGEDSNNQWNRPSITGEEPVYVDATVEKQPPKVRVVYAKPVTYDLGQTQQHNPEDTLDDDIEAMI